MGFQHCHTLRLDLFNWALDIVSRTTRAHQSFLPLLLPSQQATVHSFPVPSISLESCCSRHHSPVHRASSGRLFVFQYADMVGIQLVAVMAPDRRDGREPLVNPRDLAYVSVAKSTWKVRLLPF